MERSRIIATAPIQVERLWQKKIHFVVHDEHDSVGVVVVEGVRAGDEITGWIMDQDKTLYQSAERCADRTQDRDP